MRVEDLKEDDKVHYVDKTGIARKGVVQRNKQVNNQLFLTVLSEAGEVEVIQDKKKVVSLI